MKRIKKNETSDKVYMNIPFTGYPDIDLEILSQMNLKDVKKTCTINKYLNNLCNRSDFWKQKINTELLYIPSTLNTVNMQVYEAAYNTKIALYNDVGELDIGFYDYNTFDF